MTKKIVLLSFVVVVLLLSLSGCGDVTYAYIRGSDGSIRYDYYINFDEAVDDIELQACFVAAENVLKQLPLYTEEGTEIIRDAVNKQFIYRRYYEDLDALYASQNMTGWESNEDNETIVTHDGMYDVYTYEFDNVFLIIDTMYGKDYYLDNYGMTVDELPEELQALYGTGGIFSYYDSGFLNIYAEFIRIFELIYGQEAPSHYDYSKLVTRFVYAIRFSNITSNADRIDDKTSVLNATESDINALYGDMLYYHIWETPIGETYSTYTLSQRSPRAALWYLISIPIAIVVGVLLFLFFKNSKKQRIALAEKYSTARANSASPYTLNAVTPTQVEDKKETEDEDIFQ